MQYLKREFVFSEAQLPHIFGRSEEDRVRFHGFLIRMRPGREADHSSPTSAEVKKMWIYTSTPPYAFMA
jgi:hypothetical protein